MGDSYQYRLSPTKKSDIAQNLVNILNKEEIITAETRRFVGDWILTDASEKRKAFFDVWDIVLKHYFPSSRPILFRAFKGHVGNGKIASFTGRIECAREFSKCKGSLIICNTNDTLKYDEVYGQPGKYKRSFYPIVDVLKKAKKAGGWGFSDMILSKYLGEDEYVMRIDLNSMYRLKWST